MLHGIIAASIHYIKAERDFEVLRSKSKFNSILNSHWCYYMDIQNDICWSKCLVGEDHHIAVVGDMRVIGIDDS